MDSLYEQACSEEPNSRLDEQPLSWSDRAMAISLLLFMGMVGVSRSGPYAIAIRMYPRTGGGGINLLQKEPDGTQRRIVGLDFHPVFDKKAKARTWNLHAHGWQQPRKHLTIFNSGIEAEKTQAKNLPRGLVVLGAANHQDTVVNDRASSHADQYCLQQLLRPSPF